MNSRDIVKVGFAVLAAVVSYNFADTIVHAEENSVEPIKETTNTQESDNLVDVIDSVVNPDVSVSTDEKDSITTDRIDTNSKLLDGWNTDFTMFVKDGSYVMNSFEDIDGQKYYFDETGNKVTGFKTIGTDAYYFNESGVLQSNMQKHQDLSTGTILYSLKKEDGQVHYYLENGLAFNGMTHLDGKIYYFENGVQSFGDKLVNGNWYNFRNDGTLSVGFVNVGNSSKYYDNAGRRQQGTFQVDKVTYETDSNGLITKASWNGVSYYCQKDSQWAWNIFGGYYFGSSGCVPTTAAMIVNTLKGTNYTPIEMGNMLYSAGIFNTAGMGSSSDTWTLVSNKFGLTYKNNLNVESAKKELLKGNMIAATVEGGKFCPWPGVSHEILLFGLDAQGYTTVYDPYTRTRNGRVHISEVFNHPSSFDGDRLNRGPFFSLGKYVDNNLYLDVSKGSGHVGNAYYTGNKVEPEVNLSIKNTGLVQGRDYKVIYSNNVNVGKGTITIIGMNMFTGKLTLTFDIIKDEMTNGTYEIVSSKNNNKVLDIVGGSISNGASVQIFNWNGSMAQQYEIIKNQNGYYTIKNVKSSLYVGVTTNWNQMKSSRLVQGVNASSKGAQFIFTRNSDGSWVISSAWDRRYVFDLYGGSTNNGSPIQIYSSNGTVAQSWKLLKVKNTREEMDKLASQNKYAIADGTYFIASSLNTSYVFDVYGGSKSDFGNITIYKNNGTVAQGWKIVHDSKGYVTFINVGSNKVLDVYGGQNVNGQNVVQYTSNNSYAQKWIIVNVGSGYKIVSALDSNYVLDLYGGRVQNFSNIQIYKSNNTKAQTWSFIKYESPRDLLNAMAKEYNVGITESTYVIECYTNNNVVFNASNGNVQLANANKARSQKWKIKKDAMGYITFINVGTNKALDVYGGKAQSFTNVWQYAYNDTYAQKWIARKNSDGSLTFVSALDKDYVLDIYGGRIQNEENIHIYRDNGTNAQKFKLTRV